MTESETARACASTAGHAKKQASRKPRVSTRMREVLAHAAAGRPLDYGCRGMSAYGGLSSTITALRRLGFLDLNDQITDAGRGFVSPPLPSGKSAPQVD